MHQYASNTQEARELLADLEYLWNQIKDLEPTKSPSTDSTDLSHLPPTATIPGLLGYSSGIGSTSMTRRSQGGKSRRRGDVTTIGGSSIYGLGGGSGGGGSLGTRSVGGRSSISGGGIRRIKLPQNPQESEEKWRRDVTWALETINEEILAMRHRYDAAVSGVSPPSTGPSTSLPLEVLAKTASPMHNYRINSHSTVLVPPPLQGTTASLYSYSERQVQKPSTEILSHHSHLPKRGSSNYGGGSGSGRDARDDEGSFMKNIELLMEVIQQIFRKRIFRILLNVGTHIIVDIAVLRGLLYIYRFLTTSKHEKLDGIIGSIIRKIFSVEIKYM